MQVRKIEKKNDGLLSDRMASQGSRNILGKKSGTIGQDEEIWKETEKEILNTMDEILSLHFPVTYKQISESKE